MTHKVFKIEGEFVLAAAYLTDATDEQIVKALLRNAKITEYVHRQKFYRDPVTIENGEPCTIDEMLGSSKRLTIIDII